MASADYGTSDRIVTQVPLKRAASDILNGIREDTGVAKTEAIQRIFEWFAALDRKMRLAILNRDVETQQQMLRLVLADMVADDSIKTEAGPLDTLTLDQLVKLQHRVTDQIATRGKRLEKDLREQLKGSKK